MDSDVLYITYDGLLDPLGASQILPYVYGISKHQRSLNILSFEKPDRFVKGGETLRENLATQGIKWTPLSFTSRLGKVGKLWDLARMYIWGFRLAIEQRVTVVHTRGHPPAQIGLLIKRLVGASFISDFRFSIFDFRFSRFVGR